MHKKVHKNGHSMREGEIDRTTSFGYWLRRRRKAPDLTQPDLTQEDPAQQIGYALDTIKKIETDMRRPSKQLAERLADVLQIGLDERIAFLKAARSPGLIWSTSARRSASCLDGRRMSVSIFLIVSSA